MATKGKNGILFAIVFLCHALPSMATIIYTVGDASGWELNVDYKSWAKGKTFVVDDGLVFNYQIGHSVLEVTGADYHTCTITNPISADGSGSTGIPLLKSGSRYFICGVPSHCNAGMKLTVKVAAAGTGARAKTPPATPGTGANTPPAIPGTGSNTPPATPGTGANTPPATPGTGANTPPAIPGTGANTPPAAPRTGANTPPAKPRTGAYTPPAKPRTGAYTPPVPPSISLCPTEGSYGYDYEVHSAAGALSPFFGVGIVAILVALF